MQAILIKIVTTIGYELASKLADALILAIRTAYAEKVIQNTHENMIATQEERRAIVIAISKATSNEERRHLSTAYNKLSRLQ